MNKELIDELVPSTLVDEESLEDYIKSPTQPIQQPKPQTVPQKVVKFENKMPKSILKKEPVKLEIENYFEIFGFALSKTTIYLFIVFIILVIGYFVWNYFDEKKKKNEKNEENNE
jgi:cbb3-type cytochrome oxidase subunit 3